MIKNNRNDARVLLISMPWGDITEPSLALGILKAELNNHGISCDVIESSMQLLRWLKLETYHHCGNVWPAGDFVFTREFEPEISAEQLKILRRICQDDQDLLLTRVKKVRSPEDAINKLIQIRQKIIPQFLDDLMDETDFSQYSLVGFTCLFDQTWSSLAFARRIKRSYPDLMLAFGGYSIAFAGPLLQKKFNEMDVFVHGDGEPVIVPLAEASCGRRLLKDVPNISYREHDGHTVKSNSYVEYNLNDSPVPNFDDWFRQIEEMKKRYQVEIRLGELPVESSRGCWWGQKHHCAFCGLDEKTIKYRRKKGTLLISQLDKLNKRYPVKYFRFHDNIMPLATFQDFWPLLADKNAPYALHYEVKSNLTANQIRLLAKGGLKACQPGIESFSTPVLKRMNKGVRAMQNIFTIYTLMSNGILVFYNLIFGIPGDTYSDYKSMLGILPSLRHLIAPISVSWAMIMRNSPLQEFPEKFGCQGPLKAHWRYQVMFSRNYIRKNNLDMGSYFYYFENPYKSKFDSQMQTLFECFQYQALNWKALFAGNKTKLSYVTTDEGISFCDRRFTHDEKVHRFGQSHRRVYETLLTKVFTRKELIKKLSESGISEQKIYMSLQDLCEARVVVHEDEEYVAIALPETFYSEKRDWWSLLYEKHE